MLSMNFFEIFKGRQIILDPFKNSKYPIWCLLWWHKTLPSAIWTQVYIISEPLQTSKMDCICFTPHVKPYFLFPDVLKRWSFQNIALEYDLSCIIRKDNISFLKKCDLILRRKMKDELFKKTHGNMIYSSNLLKRWFFQQNCTGIWFFLYHHETWHFIFTKTWYFFYGRKMKYDLSQKIQMVFLFPTNMILPFCQKSKNDLFPKNKSKNDISDITEKDDIGILDRHWFPNSYDSLYFYEDLINCFHILLSNDKNQSNLIYRFENWLYL